MLTQIVIKVGRHGVYAGDETVQATVKDGIALHHSIGDSRGKAWTVTHVATGLTLAAYVPYRRAQAIAAKARKWPVWARECTAPESMRLRRDELPL